VLSLLNSTAIDSLGKFRNPIRSNKIIRRISDQLCIENGLSIIENPKPTKGHYDKWIGRSANPGLFAHASRLGDEKEPSVRERLELLIDKILADKPANFDEFIKLLELANCEFRHNRRSVRLSGQKGFIRLKSLSEDYTENAICERILGKRTVVPKKKINHDNDKRFNLLIDIQNSIKAQNSPGYERWAKIFNLKQAAQTLLFLQDNDITELGKLNEQAQAAKDNFNDLQTRIHAADSRMKEISELQKHIGVYSKTKGVYAEYKKSKYNKKFYAEYENDIEKCKTAKAYFDGLKLEKLPTVNMLKQEYITLSADKKKCYSEFSRARKFMQDILMARQNVQQLLNYRDEEMGKEANRAER